MCVQCQSCDNWKNSYTFYIKKVVSCICLLQNCSLFFSKFCSPKSTIVFEHLHHASRHHHHQHHRRKSFFVKKCVCLCAPFFSWPRCYRFLAKSTSFLYVTCTQQTAAAANTVCWCSVCVRLALRSEYFLPKLIMFLEVLTWDSVSVKWGAPNHLITFIYISRELC